ncbi:hypothetical protein N7450_004779 [Penicillium hetheringtonii]|uniref:Major facilitator superfamily (MFS) profile domain-containing protein n=1 Tax=Penicillium hetheringtonii TaxID=911720 RepID=A0AAD6GVH4_9EURO|nr:hypothetical protein N7450_004779 [Penicillium hetheringtonii]
MGTSNAMSPTTSRASSIEDAMPAMEEIQTKESKAQHQPENGNALHLVQSHLSNHDMPVTSEFREVDAEQYLRFSPSRKIVIVAVLSFCSFLAPISSTSILSGIPEVAATYDTTGSIINASNALYLAFMGIAAPFWGPFSQVWGRRPIFLVSAFLFFAFSIGTALAPNLPAYYIFRVLTAFQGTSFLVVGSSAIGDVYEPRARATALGWFLSGTLIGPALGPFIGGVIVTFCSWRVVFWLQTALGGFGTLLVFFFFPETYPHLDKPEVTEKPAMEKAQYLWHRVNPLRVGILLFTYPNLFFAGIAAGALVWNQYSLLTPIRYVLNPRFHLTTPIQSALFYIAPGCGYLVGTFMGGRWADHTVKKWIRKRGKRVPEDRLKSCLVFLGVIIPGCILVYGWTVEKAAGGIPVPVLAIGRSAEVVAGNYMFRYVFAALGSGLVLPAVEKIGVGWFSTISAIFLVFAGCCVWATTIYGDEWRNKIDAKNRDKTAQKMNELPPQQEGEKKSRSLNYENLVSFPFNFVSFLRA